MDKQVALEILNDLKKIAHDDHVAGTGPDLRRQSMERLIQKLERALAE